MTVITSYSIHYTKLYDIACPCALALTIPFTFGSTMRQFGRKGFYLKNADVIEKLYRTTAVVFDKTGTITHAQSANIQFNGKQLSTRQKDMIRSLARQSSHPLSKTLFDQLPEGELFPVENYREIPSLGTSSIVAGEKINMGSRYFVTGSAEGEEELKTQVWINIAGEPLGYFQFENKYREGLKETIETLGQHYDLHLISGDNESERENLLPLFKDHGRLNFNQSPTDKLKYIQNLQMKGESALMIGDGLNDAVALKESRVGVVIADNIYNFTPACDAILQAGKFSKLDRFIQFRNNFV